MRLNYRKMREDQLGDELLRYINGNVEETPDNVREFDSLTREIAWRLKHAFRNGKQEPEKPSGRDGKKPLARR